MLLIRRPWDRQPQEAVELGGGIKAAWSASAPGKVLGTNESTVISATNISFVGSVNGVAASFATSASTEIQLAADADTILGTAYTTIAVLRRCRDTTMRNSTMFGYQIGGFDAVQASCYSDGNLYWDFGDQSTGGRLSVAYTKDTNWETLVFVAGQSKGREIWRRGVKIAGNATKKTVRPATTGIFNLGAKNGDSCDNEDVALIAIADQEWSDAKIQAWCANPYGETFAPRSTWVPEGAAASGAYTITADAGAYTLAGQDAALVKTRIVTADAGSYAVGGQDASVLVGHLVTADAGAYSVAGQDATLLKSKLVTADAGAYTIAGQDATLAYTPTGVVYTLTADAGAYTVAGQDATLLKSKLVTADAGAYTVAGQDAVLLRGRLVTADAGAYTVAGQDATLTAGVPTTYVRNANLYLDIGSDLSIMLGNPRMPSWNTTGRPSAPLNYVYGFNTDTNAIEVWTGSAWV